MITFESTLQQAIDASVRRMTSAIEAEIDVHRKRVEQMRSNSELLTQLQGILPDGCSASIGNYWGYENPTVNVRRDCLVALRKAIGPLHVNGKQVESSRDNTIRVTLRADSYPGIDFDYIRELDEHSRCKIVEHQYKSTSLACSIG